MVILPPQIDSLIYHPDFKTEKLRSLEMLQNIGATLLVEYKYKLNEVLPRIVYELYRVSVGFFSHLDYDDALRKIGSVVKASLFIDIKVLQKKTVKLLPPERIGETC